MAKSRQLNPLQFAEWTVGIAIVVAALSGCQTIGSTMRSHTFTVRLAEDENRVYIRDVQRGFDANFAQPPWKESELADFKVSVSVHTDEGLNSRTQ